MTSILYHITAHKSMAMLDEIEYLPFKRHSYPVCRDHERPCLAEGSKNGIRLCKGLEVFYNVVMYLTF